LSSFVSVLNCMLPSTPFPLGKGKNRKEGANTNKGRKEYGGKLWAFSPQAQRRRVLIILCRDDEY
jgi:hypothetical protein